MNYTKAGMLFFLKQNLPTVNILPLLVVRSDAYFESPDNEIERIREFSEEKPLVIRSSSTMEDQREYSNAGKFESLLNVVPDYKHIKEAVEKVYASYMTQKDEEILVQPMLQNIIKSGVVFTADMDTFASYYTVNYQEGEDSAAVTSGNYNNLRTFIKYKYDQCTVEDADMKNLLQTCGELETFLENNSLDIEFAIDKGGVVYILQVRPIARGNKEPFAEVDLSSTLNRIYKKVCKLMTRHPFLLGDTTCFGVMPDWNPAEILGVRPKKLSISLYKELVTDNIWAHQRCNYGYRDLTMHPLMISFCGVPYIDTRITFNSFIPEKLNTSIAEKLANYYLNQLAEYPKYHDKIEFEIVFSCYYFGLPQNLNKLLQYGFNENEITRIEFSLLELTNNIINPTNGLYKKDIERIGILEKNYEKIVNSEISLVDKIYWLLEECKAYGTLPFAGVARAAFIAVQFLKSFVTIGIITEDKYNAFMNSLDTVNKKMNLDLKDYYAGNISKDEFCEKYGHIRPGTYDIMSNRYDEAFDEYFSPHTYLEIEHSIQDFRFSEEELNRIQVELDQNGLLVTVDELMTFIKESIEGREYLKFVFTKSVSKILQLIEQLGIRTGITKDDMAHLDISVVKQLYVDLYAGDIRTIFEENIRNNKIQYENALCIKLPSIIVKPENVYSFYLLSEEPNYITQKSVTANVITLDKNEDDFEGKIVFIQAADPGFDFLFSKNIAGLVTQFGGANSHMAIRCAELGIPAIIGVGEKNYQEWTKCIRITIDCLKKQVIKIK